MEDTNTPDNWLDVDEAARAYKVSTRTIYRRLAQPDHGGLVAQLIVTGKGKEWRVAPPPGEDEPELESILPTMIPLDSLERVLAPLAQERDRLLVDLDKTRSELATAQEARRQDAHQIGQLEGELHATKERLAALEAELRTTKIQPQQKQESQQESQEPPKRLDWPEEQHRIEPRRRWFWQRSD